MQMEKNNANGENNAIGGEKQKYKNKAENILPVNSGCLVPHCRMTTTHHLRSQGGV